MARKGLFVASSHTDSAWTRQFVAGLRALGFDVWYDLDNLKVGSGLAVGIEAGLQNRDVIVIISPDSLRSKWIQFEINAALGYGLNLIPVQHMSANVSGVLANRYILNAIGTLPHIAAQEVAARLNLPDPAPVIRHVEGIHVFLSHASEDNTFTRKIQRDLEDSDVQCWVDYTDIMHGDFYQRINEGLSQSNWLVLIVSQAALSPEKEVIRREVNAAMGMISTGEIHDIIGVVAAPFTLHQMPPLWRNLQRYDATKSYQEALAGLLEAIKRT